MTEIDAREVRQLHHDLGKVAGRIVPDVEAVVFKGAMNIKKDWANRWKGLGNLPRVGRSITFDIKHNVGEISAEIGADRSRSQGNLAHVPEFGTPTSAPHPGGGPALRAEEAKFLKALADAAGKVLE